MLVSVTIFLVAIMVLLFVFFKFRSKENLQPKSDMEMQDEWRPVTDIVICEHLGSGHFGEVYRGKVSG